jgi:hypothetical protein
MKKITIILCALALIGLAVWAQARTTVVVVGQSAAAAADECAGMLVCQNFEGTGYDHSETWTEAGTGTVNEDYTDTILRGSQSLYVVRTSSTTTTTTSFTEQSTVHVAFRVRIPDLTDDLTFFRILDSSNNVLVRLVMYATGDRVLISHGTSTNSYWYSFSNSTTYYMWITYIAGTGANGTTYLYVSTTGTKPETPSDTQTDGTATANAAKIALVSDVASRIAIFDQVLVSSSTIGNLAE